MDKNVSQSDRRVMPLGADKSRGASPAEEAVPPGDDDDHASQVDHPTRRVVLTAIEEAGEPLTVPDLHERIGDSALNLSCLKYHVNTLVEEKVLAEAGELVIVGPRQPLYFFA